MSKSKREYNINKKMMQGKEYNWIKFTKDRKNIFEVYWKVGDKEREKKAILSADICILKNKLNYNTKKLTPKK